MYTPQEREIFEFWDGSKVRKIDPMPVFRKLHSLPDVDLQADMSLLQQMAEIPKEAMQAMERLLPGIREAFGVEPFGEDEQGNQRGLLDVEVLNLFGQFGAWMKDLSKKKNPIVTSPPSTDLDASQTMKPTLASG